MGYAERDPSADIEGADACRKVCILASLAFGKHVYPDSVYTEGITKISLDDVAYAADMDCVIKLIGRVQKLSDSRITATVYPAFISHDSQLATVVDVFNAVLVRGDAIGDVVFYGKGAGKLPTASAVVADVIDCVKHIGTRKLISWEDCHDPDYVVDYKTDTVSMYVCMQTQDRPALQEAVKQQFGVVRTLSRPNAPGDAFAFATGAMPEAQIDQKLSAVSSLGTVTSKIRILSDI